MPNKLLLVNPRAASQGGQVLVIILLIMIVGLTSGLFLLGRTTTDVTTSSSIEESTRAFNAAEAGIEDAIRSANLGSSPIPLASGLTYQVNVNDLGISGFYPATKNTIKIGDVFTVWLVPHDDLGNLVENESRAYSGGSIDVCFSDANSLGSEPAISIALYYKNGSSYESSVIGVDPDGSRRNGTNANKFEGPEGIGSPCVGQGYGHRKELKLNNPSDFGIDLSQPNVFPIALRIQPYYDSASIAVSPATGASLPKQGNKIASTGTSGVTTRKIEVSEEYTQPAPFLDQALYSFGTNPLSK